MSKESTVVNGGIGVGVVMASILSFSINKSILWMFLHALCGWLYVFYFAIWK